MERRLHSRHRAKATVYLVVPGRRGSLCRAHNLSANGVFVETRNLGLAKGSIVELAFANLGTITKIHRRKAIVAHLTGRNCLKWNATRRAEAPTGAPLSGRVPGPG
jgi:hypothetical protein